MGPSKDREQELLGKIRELESFININPDIFYVIDLEGKLVRWNKGLEELAGLGPEELMNRPAAEFVVEEDREAVQREIKKVFETGFSTVEARFLSKGGTPVPHICNGSALRDEDGKLIGLTGTGRDISDRIALEAAREKTLVRQQELNHLQEYLLGTHTLNDKLKAVTDSIVDIFGADFCRIWMIRRGDLCDKGCIHLKNPGPEQCRSQDRCLHLMVSSGRYTHIDGGHQRVPLGSYKIGRLATEDQKKFLTNNVPVDPHIHNREWARGLGLASFAGYKLKDSRGKTRGVLALFSKQPITPEEDVLLTGLGNSVAQVLQTSVAEEAIKRSLREKEVLLGEIHHRVKNNLQVISSLLRLQGRNIKDKKYTEMMRDSQNRLRTMSLIHEKLYMADDLSHIDFGEYARDLTRSISDFYSESAGKVLVEIEARDVWLGINTAIPLGLILNELTTNSFKYAFPGGAAGKILITLRKNNENILELTFRDSGIGLPEGIDFRNTESLGLQLVTALSERQLQGKVELDRSQGTEFRISFKEKTQ